MSRLLRYSINLIQCYSLSTLSYSRNLNSRNQFCNEDGNFFIVSSYFYLLSSNHKRVRSTHVLHLVISNYSLLSFLFSISFVLARFLPFSHVDLHMSTPEISLLYFSTEAAETRHLALLSSLKCCYPTITA